jgi:KaiC/GvpD/RAD55 family RecA-like ATPase
MVGRPTDGGFQRAERKARQLVAVIDIEASVAKIGADMDDESHLLADQELPKISVGNAGLDDILGGGIDPERMYLFEGQPGSGKTTLALEFLLEGARLDEPTLYITLSETERELRLVAKRHGWSLKGVTIFELIPTETSLDPRETRTSGLGIVQPSSDYRAATAASVSRAARTTASTVISNFL